MHLFLFFRTQSRHSAKLDELFGLVFHVRTRLLAIRQEKILQGLLLSSADETNQASTSDRDAGSISPMNTEGRPQDWNDVSDNEDNSLAVAGPSSQSQQIPIHNAHSTLRRQESIEFLGDLRAADPLLSSNNMEASSQPSSNRPSWRFYDNDVDGQQSPPRMRNLSLSTPLSVRSSQVRGVGRARARGRGIRFNSSVFAHEDDISLFTTNRSSATLYPSQPPLADLTMELETEGFNLDPSHNGYFLMREPPRSPDYHLPPAGGFHNSEFYTLNATNHPQPAVASSSSSIQLNPSETQLPTGLVDQALEDSNKVSNSSTADASPALVELSYDQICQNIIRNSILLLFGVKPAITFRHHPDDKSDKSGNFSSTIDNIQHEDGDDVADSLPSAKSSETFRSPESRYYNSSSGGFKSELQRKGAALVRRLGRNVLRFVSAEVIKSKQDWYSDGLASMEGWNSDPVCIIKALYQQEERVKQRIEALNQVFELISTTKENCEDDARNSNNSPEPVETVEGNGFISSVHEFLLAGCYQLGLSAPLLFTQRIAGGPEQLEANLNLTHYIDYVRAAPVRLQIELVTVVHKVMRWLIASIRGFIPEESALDVIKKNSAAFQSEELKILNVFAISCRFRAKDIKLVVSSGLLSVLEKLVAVGGQQYSSPSTILPKGHHDIWPGLPLSQFVTLASVRLLHVLAVSSAIHVESLDEELIEKVVDVLHGQVYGMLRALCGDRICNVDGSSPTRKPTAFIIYSL